MDIYKKINGSWSIISMTDGGKLGIASNTENNNRPKYAIYSATDTSLTFYANYDTVTEGLTYGGKEVTKIYKDFDGTLYTGQSRPGWYEYKDTITSVSVAEEFAPIYTAYWFNGLKNCVTLDISLLNTKNTTNLSGMFYETGYDVANDGGFQIIGLNDLDLSSATDINSMLAYAGYKTDWYYDLSGWDVSKVKNMYKLFNFTGRGGGHAFNIGDLSGWDVSNVENMELMFSYAGYSSYEGNWYIGDITGWNTGNVTNMDSMFEYCGHYYDAITPMDLSGWDVSKVTKYGDFNKGVAESKIIPPNFSGSETNSGDDQGTTGGTTGVGGSN